MHSSENDAVLNHIHQDTKSARLIAVCKRSIMRQIPGLTSLPSTLTAKKSTKIRFPTDKIYYNLSQEYPKIINM